MSSAFDLEYLCFETQLGWILVASTADGVARVDFLGPIKLSDDQLEQMLRKDTAEAIPRPASRSSFTGKVMEHLLDYFRNRIPLPAIPVDFKKGTDFERKIWGIISTIPFGETRSYKQVATAAGCPEGARAAGVACGRNPVPIVVPCHRVITSSGGLGGFSGGLDIKRALLDLERSNPTGR